MLYPCRTARPASVLEVVDVKLGDRSYPIYIGPGLLQSNPEFLTKHVMGKKVLSITNEVRSASPCPMPSPGSAPGTAPC